MDLVLLMGVLINLSPVLHSLLDTTISSRFMDGYHGCRVRSSALLSVGVSISVGVGFFLTKTVFMDSFWSS